MNKLNKHLSPKINALSGVKQCLMSPNDDYVTYALQVLDFRVWLLKRKSKNV